MSKPGKNKRRWFRKLRSKLVKQNPYCFWCNQLTLNYKNFVRHNAAATLDHLIPESKGGKHIRENLVLSCYGCNQKRGNTDAVEWLNNIKTLTETINSGILCL